MNIETKIEKAILEKLVVDNKQSMMYAVSEILKVIEHEKLCDVLLSCEAVVIAFSNKNDLPVHPQHQKLITDIQHLIDVLKYNPTTKK